MVGKRSATAHRTVAQMRKHGRKASKGGDQTALDIKKRGLRNAARKMVGLAKGDPRDAMHTKKPLRGVKTAAAAKKLNTRSNLAAGSRSKNRADNGSGKSKRRG